MQWKHSLSGIGSLGLLLSMASLSWAGGTQITAVTDPIANWIVTLQWIIGTLGTLLIMFVAFSHWRSELAGWVTIFLCVCAVAFAVKAPDIMQSMGPQRAIAQTAMLVHITAWQQVLDATVTWLVHTGWLALGGEGVRRVRRATRL